MHQRSGLLFVFSGPSGSGKNTIMDRLKQLDPTLEQLPTATTRCKRDNEQNGREHEFLTLTEFRQRILDKSLIEWQIIHHENVYGVPRQTIQAAIQRGKILIADVDVLGAASLKEEFGDYVVLIFVSPPDVETLEKRLRQRADMESELELQARLRRSVFELGFAERYDYRLDNPDDGLEMSVTEAQKIIQEEIRNKTMAPARLGWDLARIHQHLIGVIVEGDAVLLYQNQLPQWGIPDGQLPFEALRKHILHQLHFLINSARPDAYLRMVDAIFEAPQIVRTTTSETQVVQEMVYIVQVENRFQDLPSEWEWVGIHEFDFAKDIRNFLEDWQLLKATVLE